MKPLVSIICISYNHAPFIEEALKSVFDQTYENLEIIVCDDASKDSSQQVIREALSGREGVSLRFNDSNVGYTATFNQAFLSSKGKFIVDFALDDVMQPEFIAQNVDRLERAGDEFGVCFSNADYIDSGSVLIGNHNEQLRKKSLIDKIPQGDVFEMVLRRYFICTPTMVMRRSVLERLNGYDEELDYEDFDFWVRSSRFTGYAYLDEVLMSKRKLSTSMSAFQYKHRVNDQLRSTLIVCKKASHLCKTSSEFRALRERVKFELRLCLTNEAIDVAEDFYELLKSLKESSFRLLMYKTLLVLNMDYRFLNKKRKKGLV